MELFSAKCTTKIRTWNVRTLHQSGKCAQVAKGGEILMLSEVRWNASGMSCINSGHTIIHSGKSSRDDSHEKADAFLMIKIDIDQFPKQALMLQMGVQCQGRSSWGRIDPHGIG